MLATFILVGLALVIGVIVGIGGGWFLALFGLVAWSIFTRFGLPASAVLIVTSLLGGVVASLSGGQFWTAAGYTLCGGAGLLLIILVIAAWSSVTRV